MEKILAKYGWPKKLNEPINSIEEIEAFIDFALPMDYKLYLQTYNGHEEFIKEEFVRLWDLDELIEENKGYRITEELPKNIGIGGNGSGEFIAIELVGSDQYRIVLSPFIDLNQTNHVVIGTSFSDFLIRLDRGKGWFD